MEVGIINVGQGAALDVDLELAFHPADETAEPVRRPWTWPLIRPGQRYQFIPPEVAGQRAPDFGLWAPVYPRVTLTGTVRTNSTRNIRCDLAVPNLDALRTLAMEAGLAGDRAARPTGGRRRSPSPSIRSALL